MSHPIINKINELKITITEQKGRRIIISNNEAETIARNKLYKFIIEFSTNHPISYGPYYKKITALKQNGYGNATVESKKATGYEITF